MRIILIRSTGMLAGAMLIFAAAGCAASITTDAQDFVYAAEAALTAAESSNAVSPVEGNIAGLVLNGLQGVIAATSGAVAADATTEDTAIAALRSALQSAMADTSDATVQKDGAAALEVLGTVSANSSASLLAQAESAAGTAFLDYLTAIGPKAARYGAEPTVLSAKIAAARARLAKLQAGAA
jgi:hypothetical protein